jgi:hypothetical protein
VSVPPTLARLVPPTLDRVGLHGFLALGALVGAVGWAVTALLAARPDVVATPVLTSVVLWTGLVALMAGVGILLTPDSLRFSRPMLTWGSVNGLATVATVGSLLDVLPDGTPLVAWSLAGLIGYTATASWTTGPDRRIYAVAAALELGTLLVVTSLTPAAGYALLGVCHALPLALVATTEHRLAPHALVATWLLVLGSRLG